MIRPGLLLAVLLLPAITLAQEINTLSAAKEAKDSLQQVSLRLLPGQTKNQDILDSLQSFADIARLKDSLKITRWSDSLRRKIDVQFSSQQIERKLDSLRFLNIPTDRISRYSDSLMQKREVLHGEVNEKQQRLRNKVSHRYDDWMKGIREEFNLDSAGIKLGDPLKKLNLPNSSVPSQGSSPGSILSSGSMTTVPGMPSLNTEDFSSLGLSKDLTGIGGDLAIPNMDQLSGMDKNLPSIPDPMKDVNGHLEEVKALTRDPGVAAEKAAGQIAEVSDATKALSEAEKLKEQNEALKMAEQINDPNALKEQAVDHFAGQEAELSGAMSQMGKYKKKYASLGSLSEIKKNDWLPKNGLKGKPFRERFRVGLHTGFKGQGDTLVLDFYPNASYRITGRLEAGLGVIYRVRLSTQDFSFDQRNPVWGTSMFAVVKTFKAIHLRFEVDGNSFPKPAPPDQPITRDWRWTFYSGIQTNFKLGKQWTGIIQMLWNFDSNLKDGFPEKLTMRAGVQYKLIRPSRPKA